LAAYGYADMQIYEKTHMILIMLHIFMANVILFNYLIAILSSTYAVSLEVGAFSYKVQLYFYC